MTGNTNKWRAPLAGLASLAMVATMGVAATTANAADTRVDVTFTVAGKTVNTGTNWRVGTSIADNLHSYNAGSYAQAGRVFTGWNADFSDQLTQAGQFEVTGETTPSDKAVTVEFTGVSSTDVSFPDGSTTDAAGVTTYYVKGNTTLGNRIPRDKVDNKVVTLWKVAEKDSANKPDYTDDLSKVSTANLAGKTLVISPAETAPANILTVEPNADGYLTGAYADGTADGDYTVNIAKDQVVTLPKTWTNYPNKVTKPNTLKWGKSDVALGGTVTGTGSNITLTPSAAASTSYQILFLDSDGSIKHTGYAKQNLTDPAKGSLLDSADRAAIADVKIDGYVVKGWKLTSDSNAGYVHFELPQGETSVADHLFTNADLDNTYFSGSVTFAPVQGGTTGTVKVTFRDDTYVGANKAVTVDAKGGTYLASDQFPSWTREGYVFAGWYLSDASGNVKGGEFTADSLIGEGDFATNFTVVATWEKVNATVLDAALAYINTNDPSKDYSEFFTSETWKSFKATRQKVVNEKKQLEYTASDGKVSDEDAAKLVTELKAGWEQLKFDAEDNPSISALDPRANSFVFRLHKDGLRLYSQTPSEIYAAQRTGWTVDNGYLFRAAAKDAQKSTDVRNLKSFENAAGQVVKGSNAQAELASKLDAIADPIVTVIERYSSPNGKDWVYTSNATEMKSLDRGGWSHEGVAFVVPTFGGTPVVRFAKGGQHLMSTGATEQASLVRNGWTREGVAFRGL